MKKRLSFLFISLMLLLSGCAGGAIGGANSDFDKLFTNKFVLIGLVLVVVWFYFKNRGHK